MLDRLLHQKRFPWFTALSILTTVGAWALAWFAVTHHVREYQPGALDWPVFDAVPYVLIGLLLNVVWGIGARIRGERWGGWIASAGIALPVAVMIGWVVAGRLLFR